ncbi:hypothetical protein [Virgibacillus sp. L01]|uniref:hypothetical protein n=1 Tax=Virgibacillus sp. L01 TaxID=3457429 RepID=UPI003FD40196
MLGPVILPLTADQELIITSDNSGSIGEKHEDKVSTPNKVVGYYACRVAIMECLAVRGDVRAIVMQNFTSDEAWQDYKSGVEQVLEELRMDTIPVTGSTESNFASLQSGLGLTIIGTRRKEKDQQKWRGNESYAVIGTPLLGEEVINQQEEIAPLWLFRQLCQLDEVKAISTVGSKGIASAWKEWTKSEDKLDCEIDLEKSSGPSTSFLIAFNKSDTDKIEKIAGSHFHILVPS